MKQERETGGNKTLRPCSPEEGEDGEEEEGGWIFGLMATQGTRGKALHAHMPRGVKLEAHSTEQRCRKDYILQERVR